MKSAITLSLVPQVRGGPFVFWDGLVDGCRKAAAFGFDAIEIFPPAARAIDFKQLTDLLAEHKLRLAALGTGAGWALHKWSLTHADGLVRSQARDFIAEIIELAARFNAPAIIGSMQGRTEGTVTRAQAMDWLAGGLEQLSKVAAAHGQNLLCEPLNRYETNILNRLSDASELIEKLGEPNLKILADLFHMNIEEESVTRALRIAAPHLGHVHFADSNRRAIGLGHTSIGRVIQVLRKMGYEGYLSAEILPLPDSETAARQTIESFRKYAA